MKKIIYISMLLISFLIGLSLVSLYYLQEFSEEVSFSDSIKYSDIKIKTEERINNYQTQEKSIYLQSANVKIGELKLSNNGYFSQIYTFPNFVGCLNGKDSRYSRTLLLISPFQNYEGDLIEKYYGYSEKDRKFEIQVDETKTFDLVLIYPTNYGDQLLSNFDRNNLRSVTIYKLEDKSNNPFGDYSNSYPYGTNCENMDSNLEAVKTIPII
jgi:hypothetical protein